MKVDNPTELLYQPFDFENHRDNFICYCECIIWPDGKIEYAVPSHNEALLKAYAHKHGLTRDEVMKMFYNDFDAYDTMMKDTGIIQVWYDQIHNIQKLTPAQNDAVGKLLQYNCISDKCLETIKIYE